MERAISSRGSRREDEFESVKEVMRQRFAASVNQVELHSIGCFVSEGHMKMLEPIYHPSFFKCNITYIHNITLHTNTQRGILVVVLGRIVVDAAVVQNNLNVIQYNITITLT